MFLKAHSGYIWRMDWGWEWSQYGGREAFAERDDGNFGNLEQSSSGGVGEKDQIWGIF